MGTQLTRIWTPTQRILKKIIPYKQYGVKISPQLPFLRVNINVEKIAESIVRG